MNENLILISVCYVFLLALVLYALIYSRLSHWFKTGLLILSVVFYCLSFITWQESQGWPASVELPQKFLLHHGIVREPNSDLNDDGEVVLWASRVHEFAISIAPRAYSMPYSKELHEKVEKANQAMESGKQQVGERIVKENLEGEENNASLFNSAIQSIEFVDLADPVLPNK